MDDVKKELIEASQRQIEAYGRESFTIVAPPMPHESPEDYARRCQAIVAFVDERYPESNTVIIYPPDNLTGVTQVGEHAYEIVTPGYEPQEKPVSERDTHFVGYTELLYPDLARLFATMYSYLAEGEEDKAKMVEVVIKDVIARRAYDLVYFLLDNAEYHSGSFDTGWGTPHEIHETISDLPDMDKWPE